MSSKKKGVKKDYSSSNDGIELPSLARLTLLSRPTPDELKNLRDALRAECAELLQAAERDKQVCGFQKDLAEIIEIHLYAWFILKFHFN